ncbi:MAG: hypothetical protein HY348_05850 [Nitrospira defluvii]|nr:hypothetical protein [Nitrospira defluvii]
MAHAPVNTSGLPHTWLPAMLISCVISLLCAGALYFILAQHDRALVAQRNAAAIATVNQSGRAMARTFAWFGESLLSEHLATVQQALEEQAPQSDLLDAAVIAEDNVIVAARNPAALGRRLQDPEWLAARRSQGGSIAPGLEQGRHALIVVEPLRQQKRIIGWIRLVLATPQDVSTVRSNEDLARDVALAVVPLFFLMTTLLILTLRGIMSQVRSRIGRILLEALDEPEDSVVRAVEMSEAG